MADLRNGGPLPVRLSPVVTLSALYSRRWSLGDGSVVQQALASWYWSRTNWDAISACFRRRQRTLANCFMTLNNTDIELTAVQWIGLQLLCSQEPGHSTRSAHRKAWLETRPHPAIIIDPLTRWPLDLWSSFSSIMKCTRRTYVIARWGNRQQQDQNNSQHKYSYLRNTNKLIVLYNLNFISFLLFRFFAVT